MIGRSLATYRVVGNLGAGGMGEVYRARDERLERDVAVKVLPADLLGDETARSRFRKEAKALSRLTHPHVATLLDFGSVDGTDYLVMELVPGPTLADVVRKGPLPPKEVVRLGTQLARGLKAAHEQGIVHRDLKPSNLGLTGDRLLKILDFGLAHLAPVKSEAQETPTETAAGKVVGSPPYMSPEQLLGKDVDARSDLYSAGACLYELATGRRPHGEQSGAALVNAILHETPEPMSRGRAEVPAGLQSVIEKAMDKDAALRYQTAAELLVDLERLQQGSDVGAAASGRGLVSAAASVRARNRRMRWSAAGVACGLAAAAAAWRALPLPSASPLPPPRVVQLTALGGWLWTPTFSPDGQQIAFQWQGEKRDNWDIYLKMVDSPEVRRLTTSAAVDVMPSWSPDGRQIAFIQTPVFGDDEHNRIHLVSPLGGAERKLSDFPAKGRPSWSPDGRWLAASPGHSSDKTAPEAGIYLVPTDGGEPRIVTRPKPPGYDAEPAFSPDGRRLAYVSCGNGTEVFAGASGCDVFVLELGPGFVPSAPPRRVTRQNLPISNPAWARDGASILYTANLGGPVSLPLFRVRVDGDHPPERIELAGFQAVAPAVAPMGHRLAFVRLYRDLDIYRFESGRSAQPVLATSAFEGGAYFSPDGGRIAFVSNRSGEQSEIWLAAADGTSPVQLTRGPGRWQGSPSWSPDGRRIAFNSQREDSHWDVWTVEVEGGTPQRLTHDHDTATPTHWSRDGRWVYFLSGRSGADEIWRVPALGGAEERVTHGGAAGEAAESADGQSLLYRQEKKGTPLVAHPLDGGPERTLVACVAGWGGGFVVRAAGIYYRSCDAGSPIRLLDPATGRTRLIATLPEDQGWSLDVSPDGKTILYDRETSKDPDLMMIENFR